MHWNTIETRHKPSKTILHHLLIKGCTIERVYGDLNIISKSDDTLKKVNTYKTYDTLSV